MAKKKMYNVEENLVEIELNDDQIDELIEKLDDLKIRKSHFHFQLDKDHEFLVHHEEDELK